MSTLVYPVRINTPGTYRFRWRSQTGRGTNTTHDIYVRFDQPGIDALPPAGALLFRNSFEAP